MKHDSGTSDDGSAIRAFFETASAAPYGDATECRWLYNRMLYDNEGSHDLDVAQISAGIVSNFQTVQMGQTGALLNSTFVLNTSALESNVSGLTSDSDLFGYDARTRLRISNYNANETFTIRRTSLQFKPIGNVRQRKTGIE